MNKKLFKIISLSTMITLMVSLTGCGSSSSKTETKSSAGEKTTYNIMWNAPFIQGYPEDGGVAKKIILESLEKAGIKDVDYKVTIGGGEYFTKINLLATSGQLPDYFTVDPATMMKLADEKLIMPLGDLAEKYAPNIMNMKNQDEASLASVEMATYKGELYAIPTLYRPEPFNKSGSQGLTIRKDWLDNLGLEIPKTLDEMHAVLKAFTEQDPDKNGKKDTYGISFDKKAMLGGGSTAIFGAFGVIPKSWSEVDGKLKQGYVLSETKEALAVYRQWYKEGLIDPEFPMLETAQVSQKFVNSKVGIYPGGALELNTNLPIPTSLKKATPTANMAMLDAPKGPTGLSGYEEATPSNGGNLRVFSAQVKNPEKLMQMINWSSDDSEKGGFYLCTYGVEGEDYTLDKDKNVVVMNKSYNELYSKGLSNPVRFISIQDRRWLNNEGAYKALEALDSQVIKNKFWGITQAITDKTATIDQIWQECFVKIVTGTSSIDSFDGFVKEYYQRGGQQMEDEVNKAYTPAK